ncbi:ATP-binding cassette, subfamily B [Pilibacter termitis]|uniref:ATP-binding cassette, subfamily B n=1 Tax=Pilibacter termitis TaxID=263852 RepID=A0A1T4NQV6_9ENTE|nr:ABC transporter transmembrane domain-containing protein [Pilibacter termitis]SJZ81476.1 ATP-binding cassette, subfamily B [Pilibacter termitis]
MQIFKKLSWFFKEEKKTYFYGIVALFIVSILHIIPPRLIGMVIDEIAKKQLTAQMLFISLVAMLIVAILEYLFRIVWRVYIFGGSVMLEKKMRSKLFDHFLKMDTFFYQKHRTGDLMAHATNDLQSVQNVAGMGVLTLADSIMTGGATILAMVLFVDWRLTILAVLPLPLLSLFSKILGERIHNAFKYSQETFSHLNDKVQESITGMKAIKTFGQEKEDIEDFQTKTKEIEQAFVKVNFYDSLFDPAIAIIVGISYSLAILLGGYLVVQKSISIGQLVSFMTYIGILVWPMFAVGMLFNIFQRGGASLARIEELLSHTSHIEENEFAKVAKKQGAFDFQIEEFSYEQERGVQGSLKNIAIHLPKGKMLGIVGKTGSGKSTLIRLLLREFDTYKGTISFADDDIRLLKKDSLLSKIAYVPQDHFLFSMSVADNIRFAKPSATEEEITLAAKMAAVDNDIQQLTNGYDTMVGERGVSLSGGQKQRLSIARALILESELLILDDALSAVDAKTEEAILTNLKHERSEQTTMITAHRLSSVMFADEIIVLDKGEIIERGRHEELLEKKGWYAEMWELQKISQEEERHGA